MNIELCMECKMPEGRHTSDCSIRLAARRKPKEGTEAIVADLTRWRVDPDVKLIIQGALRRHGVSSMADLSPEALADLHESIGIMLEESPTIVTMGDPRRMV